MNNAIAILLAYLHLFRAYHWNVSSRSILFEAGRFGAAVLARPVWRRRFGAGPFCALPFWRRTFWRKYIQISTHYMEAGMMKIFLP